MKTGLGCSFLRRIALLVSVAGLIWGSPSLFSQALTPEQVEKIAEELKRIQVEVDGQRLSQRSSAVAAFQKAAASDKGTLDLYFDCYKEVRYDRQDARSSDFRDWREKNEVRIRDKGNLTALRMQLQYLILTLRAAENVPLSTLVPELEGFAANVVGSVRSLQEGAESDSQKNGERAQGGGKGGQGGETGLRRLRESVTNTVFAEAYGLDKSLKVDGWSKTPGDIGSLYKETILPYYQREQPAMVAAAWDRRVKLEMDYVTATSTENPTALEIFKAQELPRLLFAKSLDIFRYVSQQQGSLAIINLLRSHPDHPSASEWLAEFRNILQQSMTPSGADVPAAGATPARP